MNSLAVLIPTKDRLELLKKALQSIFNQTQNPDEIIVINDGSTDKTDEYLENLKKDHGNLKVINRDKNGGVNTARNQGIKIAISQWIAFLDDDDEFVPDAVKIIKEKISILPETYGVAYFNSEIHRDQETFIGGFQFDRLKNQDMEFYDPTYQESMTKFNLKGDCKQVLRRSLFENNKYQFPESVNGYESYTMNLLARDGVGIRYFPQVLTIIHQESAVPDRLSIEAPRKNSWPLFVLHFKQLFQHWKFYIWHPLILLKKKLTMTKLLVRTLLT